MIDIDSLVKVTKGNRQRQILKNEWFQVVEITELGKETGPNGTLVSESGGKASNSKNFENPFPTVGGTKVPPKDYSHQVRVRLKRKKTGETLTVTAIHRNRLNDSIVRLHFLVSGQNIEVKRA